MTRTTPGLRPPTASARDAALRPLPSWQQLARLGRSHGASRPEPATAASRALREPPEEMGAAALRATVAEWQDDAAPGAPRTLRALAEAAGVPEDVVRRVTRRGQAAPVPAVTAARLLWVMGEPLRRELREALTDDLYPDAGRAA